MENHSEKDKRIARNTLLLYFRMLFLLLVSLYTSRVVLHTLGVVDFGVFNVVAGVVALLGFLNGALGSAASRYITYAIGQHQATAAKQTFGNILTLYLGLAVLILVLGETLGLWFVLTRLQIPPDRTEAALWVYQCSILSSILTILNVPYNATIIAHEKMAAFAYISMADAVLKLLVACLLLFSPYDKLIVYSLLFLGIQLFDWLLYRSYCRRHFKESHSRPQYDRHLFREIFVFAGWTVNGNLAIIGYTQGLNILLNLFFGPAVNAARGIAVQVQNVCMQFCTNFQMALNPQLTKSYAAGDLEQMHRLLVKSSKFSYYILLVLVLPLLLLAEFVLHLWLGMVPEHTVSFLRLILCVELLFTLSNPIIVSVHATGRLKKFQLVEGSMLLTIVPIAYLLLKVFHLPAESIFVVHFVMEALTQYARLRIVLPLIRLSLGVYARQVLLPILVVTLTAPVLPIVIRISFPEQNWDSFFLIGSICLISTILSTLYLGCTQNERRVLFSKAQSILNKCGNFSFGR